MIPNFTIRGFGVRTLVRAVRQRELIVNSLCEEGLGFLTLWPRVSHSIPGWLCVRDARLLYSLAYHGPGRGAIVEIGSAWGRSTVILARGSKAARRERVYAIDPHTGDPWFFAGFADVFPPLDAPAYRQAAGSDFSSADGLRYSVRRFGVEDWVVPVVATSTEAASRLETGPIRLLYVDGLHSYEGVRADIRDWAPRVVPGGVIVFDDYFNANPGVGVRRAVDELLGSGLVEPGLQTTRGSFVWTRRR